MRIKMIKFLNEKMKPITIVGLFLIAISAIGNWIASIPSDTKFTGDNKFLKQIDGIPTYNYSYLEIPSALLFFLSLVALCPAVIKLALMIIGCLWKITKRIIYEIFYEATRGIKDAKLNKDL